MTTNSAYPRVHPIADGVPIRAWTDTIEPSAWRQLAQVARLPILHAAGVAVMPDVHVGYGACVGSVIPTRGALIPSAAGVDLGCGMMAVLLDLTANDLPDHLKGVRVGIEQRVPVGQAEHKDNPAPELWAQLQPAYRQLVFKYSKLFKRGAERQLGTLGGGNHFIEICLDEQDRVWVMLHSGSRGVGNTIGSYFIERARHRMMELGLKVPDRNLAWLSEGDPLFDDYVAAVLWAQDYARENRALMMAATLRALGETLRRRPKILGEAVNCHHNYVARETHGGEELWITRKGAIRAGVGEWGIIPGSMGTRSYIVRGKGVAASYCSCAHGAGRAMSRADARATFTLKDLRQQTSGVECRKDKSVIDEAPGAYKDIDQVMGHQTDLVEVLHTLRQLVCVKG
jgi:tRNA-splicing ligase RtcB